MKLLHNYCLAAMFVSLFILTNHAIAQSHTTVEAQPSPAEVVNMLNSLTKNFFLSGEQAELVRAAETAYENADENLQKTHPSLQIAIGNLTMAYQIVGRFSEAEPLHKLALATSKQVHGESSEEYLRQLNNFGGFYLDTGQLSLALNYFNRALPLSQRMFGEIHPATLTILNNMAELHRNAGRRSLAENMYVEVLEGRKSIFGSDHPETIGSLNNLAVLYSEMNSNGKYSKKIESLLNTAHNSSRKILGPEHPLTLSTLSNLGEWYVENGDYQRAESVHREVLSVRLKNLGPEHPSTMVSLNNLATIFSLTGRFQLAAKSHSQLAIARTKTLGANHPDTLITKRNLAETYNLSGRIELAEKIHQEVLDIQRKILGDRHPDTISTMIALASSQISGGKMVKGSTTLGLSLFASQEWAEDEADTSTTEDRRRASINDGFFPVEIIYAFAAFDKSSHSARLAADAVLNRKALIGERSSELFRVLDSLNDPEIDDMAEEYMSARRNLAVLFGRHVANENSSIDVIRHARNRVDRTKTNLINSSNEFRKMRSNRLIDSMSIRDELSPRESLIEFIKYYSFDFRTNKWNEHRRIAAIVMTPTEEPVFVDLGLIDEIAPVVQQFAKTMGSGGAGYIASHELYQLIVEPLQPYLARSRVLYISPIGELGAIPFEELRRRVDDRRWADTGIELRMVITGRSLISKKHTEYTNDGSLLALGDIDYDVPAAESKHSPSNRLKKRSSINYDESNSHLYNHTKNEPTRFDTLGKKFSSLLHTNSELIAIEKAWNFRNQGKAKILSGRQAHEGALYNLVDSPRVLHLATHGFVIGASNAPELERPALLSGIALTGANISDNSLAVDGIMFGYEIESLPLEGTELVVVSACETGIGAIDESGGIYNLARAFRLAGAESVLVTLLPIDDLFASKFIEDFYNIWLTSSVKLSPAKALINTKQIWANSKNPERSDPINWAPYILIHNQI